MKHFLHFISIIAFLFSSITLAQTNSLHIDGKITDKVTGENLSAVTLYISNLSNGTVDSTFTNSAGNWQYDLTVTSLAEYSQAPVDFFVSQNYPNPFNPSTKINLTVPQPGNVIVTIYNTLGEKVDGCQEFLNPGYYSIDWNARGSAGVYFLNIKTGDKSFTKKMILLDGGFGTGLSRFHIGSNTLPGVNKLNKITTPIAVQIRTSKFAYIPYTVDTALTGDSHFEFSIETIHSHSRLFDLHNDILEIIVGDTSYHLKDFHTYNQTDIPRMKVGGVDAQFFAVWVDPSSHGNDAFNYAMSMVDRFNSELALDTQNIGQARTADEVVSLNNKNKIAAILAVEGGHAIENDLEKLATLYNAGMRYLTITWNNSTDWAVSAKDSRSTTVGLSEFGRTVIRTLDSLGVIIDVSHTGIKTIEDILSITTNPIIATHSGARALHNHYRNLYDNQIIAIANTGGFVGIVFYPPFLSSNGSVDVSRVVDHIDYIVNLVGIDHVAVGSDFDGIGNNTVVGLENISKFPNLTLELLTRGYTQTEIEKILGGNVMRVFQQVAGFKKTLASLKR
ncbi:MAG: membrane dipeptidase [Ignavibacteriaceae bacterium]|nr:membrane dipeptidase [Ignavibacteriaceae bacterium]